ncbi:hypothetical protein CDL15_Pgr004945 [Punica granatum]|nr:hypothetical protein CDL15_Pgr004945 [Punica granatum]
MATSNTASRPSPDSDGIQSKFKFEASSGHQRGLTPQPRVRVRADPRRHQPLPLHLHGHGVPRRRLRPPSEDHRRWRTGSFKQGMGVKSKLRVAELRGRNRARTRLRALRFSG